MSNWNYGPQNWQVSTTQTWILVKTKPRQEHWAKKNIENQGCEAFLPLFRDNNKEKIRKPLELKPLFPSYLPVKISGAWNFLKSTYGVSHVVMTAGYPAIFPPQEIDKLKRMQARDGTIEVPQHRFDLGQEVRFKRGPLADTIGRFCGLSGKERVKVLLGCLTVIVPDYLLEAV
jgi:transcriptional antiterminator RfaH